MLPSENTLFKAASIGFGLICGIAIIALMNQLNLALQPTPDLSEWGDNIQDYYHSDNIYLLGALISHGTGSFFAGAIPVFFKTDIQPINTLFTGIILTVLAIINVAYAGFPSWYIIANILLYIPLVWLGTSLSLKYNLNI